MQTLNTVKEEQQQLQALKAPQDANTFQKPKRLSPFLLFVKTRRSYYEKQHAGDAPLTMRDVLYEAGKEWHTLTEA
jgi:hypothetical protein